MPITSRTILARSLTGRLFSTLTTILTVAVAVALMVVLLAMRDSGMKAFNRGSGNMHLVMSQDSGPLPAVLNNVFHAGVPKNAINWSTYSSMMSRPRPAGPPIKDMLDWAIPLQTGDSYQGFPVVATTGAFFTKFQPVAGEPLALQAGRFFESPLDPALTLQEPLSLTRQSAILEAVVGAEAFAATGLAVGQRIHMAHGTGEHAGHIHDEDEITVVGVLAPTGSAHDRAIFIDLGTGWLLHARDFHEQLVAQHQAVARQAAEQGRPAPPPPPSLDDYLAQSYTPLITGVYLRAATRPGKDVSATLPALMAALRADNSISAVASPSDQIGALFRIVGNINQILVGMAVVVMVSSGIAIMLALYNSMEQRRRQIAVLRVLGASRVRIFTLILAESAILGLLGAAVGLILAAVGGVIVSSVMQARLGLSIRPSLWITQTFGSGDSSYTLPLTPMVIGGTILLAAIAGIIPAVMAYRTSVARNLRPLG